MHYIVIFTPSRSLGQIYQNDSTLLERKISNVEMNHISPRKAPFERYAREIGLFALVGVKIKDILKPPPTVDS